MKCIERYWNGYRQMTLRRRMTGISRKDLKTPVNGFWKTLDLEIGEIRHSPACFGVMEHVSPRDIPTNVSLLTHT